MPDETRITANPLPTETRITAEPPSRADTRICLNYPPKEEGLKTRFLPLFFLRLSFVIFCAVVFWQAVRLIEARMEFKQRQAETREMQEKIDRFIQEVQRGK
ncbi:MAG TPA: hypothetical protein VH575_29920 [Gemmataceae bacterium]|jgi:hypothetical protein